MPFGVDAIVVPLPHRSHDPTRSEHDHEPLETTGPGPVLTPQTPTHHAH
jgi:hypothetical protein